MAPDYDKKVPKFEMKVLEFEKAPEFDKKYLKKAGGYIDRNVVQITIKMRTIVRIIQIILILRSSSKVCCIQMSLEFISYFFEHIPNSV